MQGSEQLANDVKAEFIRRGSSLNAFCENTLKKDTSNVLKILRGRPNYKNGRVARAIREQVVLEVFPNGYPANLLGSNDESMD